jgi:hypothetical protein
VCGISEYLYEGFGTRDGICKGWKSPVDSGIVLFVRVDHACQKMMRGYNALLA